MILDWLRGMTGWLTRLFRGKIKNVGYWYLVDWSGPAKEFSVGNDFCKKIYLMYDNGYAGETSDYTDAKIRVLKQNTQIVMDLTQGLQVPRESNFVPRTQASFGTIQLFKRIY